MKVIKTVRIRYIEIKRHAFITTTLHLHGLSKRMLIDFSPQKSRKKMNLERNVPGLDTYYPKVK